VGTTEQPGPQTATNVVSLRLRKHLIATGKVVSNGPPGCVEGIPVTIVKRGKVVKSVNTDELGRYRLKLRDRTGTYRAEATAVDRGDVACSADTSPKRRHRH
jgi:hypothetical protein